jgi:hypothetical protein
MCHGKIDSDGNQFILSIRRATGLQSKSDGSNRIRPEGDRCADSANGRGYIFTLQCWLRHKQIPTTLSAIPFRL